MKKLNKNKLFTTIIISIFIIGFFYFSLGYSIQSENKTSHFTKVAVGKKLVTKILDGDTVIIEGGYSVRLLGIDADEKGYPCYEVAKQRLEELVLNKEVYLESAGEDQDQYQRYLRYLILDNENINLKLVKEGLVIARFSPGNMKYREELIAAEKEAIENKIGCKWSGKIQPIKKDFVWSKLAGDAIGAYNAGNYIGEEKIVEGRIVDSHKDKTNTVFLNFEKYYPNQYFTAVIFSSDLINFPEDPQNYYEGKTVRVKGVIERYKEKPEIILKDRTQIEVGE